MYFLETLQGKAQRLGTPEPSFLSMVLNLWFDDFAIKFMHEFEMYTLNSQVLARFV